ncbi:nucleotide disphospho-sugar-binding domain-containing protein [uncultured Pseudonocardia sp.]|uniref:nucleotide disphospho-sugar-binding domain-containing protein n=1 Tax=uncultured Pseudonocardia sp. TaxID=211455 RepID=UPI00261DE171|nr:nucleotide disphospho-sugar-binding domain-containing protein [uncultured Pseudonocardia sp.]
MRVLFTTWAWPSHLHAMVPLAWACRAAGHDVVVACQPGLVADVRRTGLSYAVVGSDVDSAAMVAGYLLPTRRFGAPAAGPARVEPGGVRIPRALQMFLANTEAMAADIVELAHGLAPDLVVHEPTAWAGTLAAAAAGVPAVRHLYGADLLYGARHLIQELLAPLAQRWELGALDPLGSVTVDPFPPSLQLYPEVQRIPVRYVSSSGFTEVPETPRRRPRRVCVSWGTTIGRMGESRMLAGEVARALHDTDAELVVAVDGRQRDQLGLVPPGVTVVVDAPLHAVAARCDVLVSHGGAGSVLVALAAGLPQLMVPQLPDHEAHATAVVTAGAGRLLAVDDVTPERIRSGVGALLDDPRPRAAAGVVAAEMARQPSPAALVPRLERLTATPDPRNTSPRNTAGNTTGGRPCPTPR